MGSIAVFDARLLGVWPRSSISTLAQVLLPSARLGFFVAVTTGVVLFVARAEDYANSLILKIKLGLLLCAVINVWIAHHSQGSWHADDIYRISSAVKISAAISLCLWIAVLFSGRLIGYR